MRTLMELQSDKEKMDLQIQDGSNFKHKLEDEIGDYMEKSDRAGGMLSNKLGAIQRD